MLFLFKPVITNLHNYFNKMIIYSTSVSNVSAIFIIFDVGYQCYSYFIMFSSTFEFSTTSSTTL